MSLSPSFHLPPPSPSMPSDATDSPVYELEESLLPSYEAAIGILDVSKLPSYKQTSSARFHPYKRPTLTNIDERDRFFNTVFDDEYSPLNVPPSRRRSHDRPLQAIDDTEATQRLSVDVERRIQLELRVQRLDARILDFIEGVRRAHIPE